MTPPSRRAAWSARRKLPGGKGVAGGGPRTFNILRLPLNKISSEIESELREKQSDDGSFLTAGRSTPFVTGLVKGVTDRWADTHATAARLLRGQPPPDVISLERVSARIEGSTFKNRQLSVEEGLKHLPMYLDA